MKILIFALLFLFLKYFQGIILLLLSKEAHYMKKKLLILYHNIA